MELIEKNRELLEKNRRFIIWVGRIIHAVK